MNFDQLIAKYVTGNWTTSDLPKLGVAGLQQGLDSESLVILAGLSEKDNSFEIKQYFDKTLEELQVDLPDKRTAAIELAIYYAQKIVEERIDPIEGTWNIINDCLGSYDFFAETKHYVMDSIGFEKAYGLYDTYDELRHADHSWSKTKTNDQLKEEVKLELIEELKNWIEKIKKTRYNTAYSKCGLNG